MGKKTIPIEKFTLPGYRHCVSKKGQGEVLPARDNELEYLCFSLRAFHRGTYNIVGDTIGTADGPAEAALDLF